MAVVEIVTFTVPAGNADAFVVADAAVGRAYVSKQPGFVSRETARGDGEDWMVIVHWEDLESAESSMARYQSAPEAAGQLALMDQSTFAMRRYTVTHS